MSWDVYIMRVPREFENVEDLPGDWEPPALGTGAEVRAVLAEHLPGIVFDADGRGEFDGPGFHMGIPLPEADSEPVQLVALFVHGGGDAPGAALAVTDALGARAIETGGGDWLTAETAGDAFNTWRAYRDRVIGKLAAEDHLDAT